MDCRYESCREHDSKPRAPAVDVPVERRVERDGEISERRILRYRASDHRNE